MRSDAWPWIGVLLASGAALFAVLRARAARGSYYEREVYGMTPRSHRAFATLSAVCAIGFVAGIVWPSFPTIALLAVFTVALILYAASFARGAAGPDD